MVYDCEKWPISVKDEQRMTITYIMGIVRRAMGASLLEHRGNEDCMEVARVEPIVMVMGRRMLHGGKRWKGTRPPLPRTETAVKGETKLRRFEICIRLENMFVLISG